MNRITRPFTVLVERFYPDPFVFAIGLSAIIFLMCIGLTDAGPKDTLIAWGDGLPALMEFIGQLSLTLVASHALAHTDLARRSLEWVGGLPRRPAVAYGMVAFVAGTASLISWALGLVVGALIARQVAIQARAKGLRLHYPLLVASAYAGFVLWSMGYSSSASLFVATPGHTMEEQMGGTLPVTETIFNPWNIGILLVGLVAVTVVMGLMKPKEGRDEIIEISDSAVEEYRSSVEEMERDFVGTTSRSESWDWASGDSGQEQRSRGHGGPQPLRSGDDSSLTGAADTGTTGPTATRGDATPAAEAPAKSMSIGERLDRTRWLSLLPGVALVVYLAFYFVENGFLESLTLDIVNWTFLAVGLLLARSLLHYVRLIGHASVTVGQIILQYPFYAGMMGMMAGTGLVEVIANWFVDISTPGTLSFWAFLSAGFINLFIPSGGGQWVVQGPIFLEAGQALNVDSSRVVMGVAYGEWSNMIQPFWTIPLLAIAGLHVRQVMGYTFVVFFLFLFVYGGGLLLAGSGA